jgi:ABC-type antimicrobial peptide transport system permease subunit
MSNTYLVALLTVGYPALKSARANPIEALRYG